MAFQQGAPGSAGSGIKKIFATGLTETSTVDKEGAGAIRFEGNKVYKWVKFNNGTGNVAAVAGNFMTYHGNDAYTLQEVTSDMTDGGVIGAGVLQAAPADGEYCWIQIKGLATLNLALTAGADGNALTPIGSTDGALDVSALVTDHVCAHAINAASKLVLLDCPF